MRWLARTLIASPYHWCLCTTEKKFHKALRVLKVPRRKRPSFIKGTADATIHFMEEVGGTGRSAVICLKAKGKGKPQVHALLVHEATHLWQEIRKHLGEEEPSAEFEAYSLQALSQSLIEEYEIQVPQPARKGKQRRKQNGR